MTKKRPSDAPVSVAGSHTRDRFADESALEGPWSQLPPVSGAELAAALRRAGYQTSRQGDEVLIERGWQVLLRIPLVPRLQHEVLVAMLRTMGIYPFEFITLLDGEVTSSGRSRR